MALGIARVEEDSWLRCCERFLAGLQVWWLEVPTMYCVILFFIKRKEECDYPSIRRHH